MNKILLIVFFIGVTSINAQDDTSKDEPKQGWSKSGKITLLFNQSAFSNWTAGGENNLAGNLGLNYDFNFLKGDWTWSNKIIAAYGISKLKGQDIQKTDDRLELNSLLGKKASNNWYYSGFLNFKTQLDYGENAAAGIKSHFFSPAFFQFGPGMLWKENDNLKVNIAPATSKLILVHDEFTNVGNVQADIDAFNAAGGYFGVDANETIRYELGASISAYYKFDIMENVSMENVLNLYSDYLEDPQNVDLDYTMNLAMTINKYLSANIAFQAIYDDNAFQGFQIKEVFGIGINYGF